MRREEKWGEKEGCSPSWQRRRESRHKGPLQKRARRRKADGGGGRLLPSLHCGSVDKKGLIGGLKRGKRKQRVEEREDGTTSRYCKIFAAFSRIKQIFPRGCDRKKTPPMQLCGPTPGGGGVIV